MSMDININIVVEGKKAEAKVQNTVGKKPVKKSKGVLQFPEMGTSVLDMIGIKET